MIDHKKVKVGDVVHLTYVMRMGYWGNAIVLGSVESNLEADPRLKYLRCIQGTDKETGYDTLTFVVEVVKPKKDQPIPVQQAGISLTTAVIASVVVGVSLLTWMSLQSVEVITKTVSRSPELKTAMGAASLSGLLLAGAAFYYIVLRKG